MECLRFYWVTRTFLWEVTIICRNVLAPPVGPIWIIISTREIFPKTYLTALDTRTSSWGTPSQQGRIGRPSLTKTLHPTLLLTPFSVTALSRLTASPSPVVWTGRNSSLPWYNLVFTLFLWSSVLCLIFSTVDFTMNIASIVVLPFYFPNPLGKWVDDALRISFRLRSKLWVKEGRVLTCDDQLSILGIHWRFFSVKLVEWFKELRILVERFKELSIL